MNDLKRINGKTCLTKKHPEMLFGYAIIVICKHYNGEQKRKHHKKRINKKWQKIYGMIELNSMPHGKIVMIDNGVVCMTKRTFESLKKSIGRR